MQSILSCLPTCAKQTHKAVSPRATSGITCVVLRMLVTCIVFQLLPKPLPPEDDIYTKVSQTVIVWVSSVESLNLQVVFVWRHGIIFVVHQGMGRGDQWARLKSIIHFHSGYSPEPLPLVNGVERGDFCLSTTVVQFFSVNPSDDGFQNFSGAWDDWDLGTIRRITPK